MTRTRGGSRQARNSMLERAGRAGSKNAQARGAAGVRARGSRRGRLRQQMRQARGAHVAWALGARAGLGLCTRCTRPVFGPVRLGIFPELLNEHYSL